MSTPPILIAETGPRDSPDVYTVPDSQSIQPQTVVATFDGAAAAGAFLACLSMYAQSGELLSRTFADTVLGIGDAAEVTFAPFRGLGAAVASGLVPFAKFDSRSETITAINTQTLLRPAASSAFSTNDPSAFDFFPVVIGAVTYHGVRFLKDGVYLLWAGFNFTGAVAGDIVEGYYAQGGGNTDGFFINNERAGFPAAGFANVGSVSWMEAYQVDPITAPAPTDPQIFYVKNRTSAAGHGSVAAMYLYLGPGLLFP